MKITSSLSTALLLATTVSISFAHGDIHCNVPKTEWQPQMALQSKLVAEGWRVRQVKLDNGCYEVYGFDDKGQRVEVYFDPKTFEKVGEIKKP